MLGQKTGLFFNYTLIALALVGLGVSFNNCSSPFAPRSVEESYGPKIDKDSIELSGEGVEGWNFPGCTNKETEDLFDTIDRAKVLPRDCALVEMNPPLFLWTNHRMLSKDPDTPWVLEVKNSSGALVVQYSTNLPYGPMSGPALEAGDYQWRVTYKTASGEDQASDYRKFRISEKSFRNALLSETEFFERITKKQHPRSMPDSVDLADLRSRAEKAENKPFYDRLLSTAEKGLSTPLLVSPESKSRDDFPNKAAYKEWVDAIKKKVRFEVRDAIAMAFIYKMTNQAKFKDGAIARCLNLSSWDPKGVTSFENEDKINELILSVQTFVYDLLYGQLTDDQKDQIFVTLRVRLLGDTTNKGSISELDQVSSVAFDNHAVEAQSNLLHILINLAGEPRIPEVDAFVKKSWTTYNHALLMFGDQDGGFENSFNYGWYAMIRLPSVATHVMTATGGFNLLNNHLNNRRALEFIMHVQPPGSEVFGFGDGSEIVVDHYRRYIPSDGRLFALLTQDSQYEWYYRFDPKNLEAPSNVDFFQITALMYYGERPTSKVPDEVLGKLFKDVGTSSFHSNLTDPQGTTILFRSSQFGSHSHAHADQNSFIMSSKGKPLLIASGYYQVYGTDYHYQVVRATRSKNAVTFDGGIGQSEAVENPTVPTAPMQSRFTSGEIVNYYNSDDFAAVSGDATSAYRGWSESKKAWVPLVSQAYRSLVYIRSTKTLLIYDHMKSSKYRRWEINFHTVNPMVENAKDIIVTNSPANACLKVLNFPSKFAQTTATDLPPDYPDLAPAQSHGRFSSSLPSQELNSVTVVQEDCADIPVTSSANDSEVTVLVGTGPAAKRVIFNQKAITLRNH